MTVRSSAGSTIKISAGIPATFNSAGYAALTLTAIGEVTDLGEFGREYALVTHNPLGTRGTTKLKGSFNEGTISMQVGLDTDDAGQILAKAASLSDNDYSFEIATQNGDKYYFQAKVMSFKVSVGSVDQVTNATIALELTSGGLNPGIVEALAA
jgi:hypothetical protein